MKELNKYKRNNSLERHWLLHFQQWFLGRILFEIGGVPLIVAKEALRLAAQKLPVKTKFVIARDYEA